MDCGGKAFSIVVGIFQVLLVLLFGISLDYGKFVNDPGKDGSNSPTYYYSFFQDVNVMIFIGFGFLMTFLKKYSFGAVGYNVYISCVVLQWATLINGWFANLFGKVENPGIIEIDLKTMITSDFAAAAVLITFGAVLGKVSRLQLFFIGIVEIIFYALNENIIAHHLQVTDVGGSMLVHMFGAYFGLAVTRLMYNKDHTADNDKEGSIYHSDVFAMIGSIFLWMFWPSFNGALLGPGTQQHRALINTYYSLAACCVITFVISPLLHKKNKIDMVHIQNATLAGGVAVGTCADLIIQPWGAALIGMIAGVISTLGYAYVTPFLASKLKIHDTCGVHNLHGMPAILAAIAGSISASLASFENYGNELFEIWGARTPKVNSTMYHEVISKGISLPIDGMGRSASSQALMQIAAMIVTLVFAIVGGTVTGLVARLLDNPTYNQLYDDDNFWIVSSSIDDDKENKISENTQLTLQENS